MIILKPNPFLPLPRRNEPTETDFEAAIWRWNDATDVSEAQFPPRPPLWRDDCGGTWGYLSDRILDSQFFAEHRHRTMRLTTPTGSDLERAGCGPAPDGAVLVRMARHTRGVKVIALMAAAHRWLNSLPDDYLEDLYCGPLYVYPAFFPEEFPGGW